MSQEQPAQHERASLVRAIARIVGDVQGVGFRPYLYQLATRHGLRGSVANTPSGVELEVEGTRQAVVAFLADLPRCTPPLVDIAQIDSQFAQPVGHAAFVIAPSRHDGHRTARISPDVSVCDDCLREMFDPSDRRFLYPFINCTNCGPRYTIIGSVPYDRPATTMACFSMCAACQAEYDDPANRRFHAQPNACPECGPHVWLATTGSVDSRPPPRPHRTGPAEGDPIDQAAQLLARGAIIAIKGLGGFHLACDATSQEAVATLRRRKSREEKPLALMVPDLATAMRLCHIDAAGRQLLTSRQRPITLLPRRGDAVVAAAVAPGNSYLGLMLPYTPLHHRLLFLPDRRPRLVALVMTSGNRKDEPIAIGNREAIERLDGLADALLLHNRDILIRADDSVVRRDGARSVFLRRSRGYVPAPIFLAGPPAGPGRRAAVETAPSSADVGPILAVGAQQKNTIAISRGQSVFLSQHIGDLEGLESLEFLTQSVRHLQQILDIQPSIVAHDLHPDYLSTRFAQRLAAAQPSVRLLGVQHHHAHVAACMAEHALSGPVIGVALDGTGYGTDGTVWGGEILVADCHQFRRAARLRQVPLPGGEQAVRQPWRMALSYLDAVYGDQLWRLPIRWLDEIDCAAAEIVLRAARRHVNSPLTSSCGRLFDAVASLAGIRQTTSYEGQAAVELEMALDAEDPSPTTDAAAYRFAMDVHTADDLLVLDPQPMVRAVVDDLARQVPAAVISGRFHRGLVDILAQAVTQIAAQTDLREVVLSGGCFLNRTLTDGLVAALQAAGLAVFTHQCVPPGDGGIALGQILVARAITARRE
jgi:hydrogenase maturation protein HypF